MSPIMFSRSGGEDGKILIIGRGVRNRAAIVAQSGLERVVACLHTLVDLTLCVSTNEHWYDF